MKHTYNEEQKDKIAQNVYDWLVSHRCPDAEMLCQCDDCTIDSVDLALRPCECETSLFLRGLIC